VVYSQYSRFLHNCAQKQEAKEMANRGEKLYGKDRSGMTVSVDGLLLKKGKWK
jgi:hypothetical protein